MIWADVIWGAPWWGLVGAGLLMLGAGLVVWSYRRSTRRHAPSCYLCPALKLLGFLLLAVCLADPLYVGTRPRAGSNLFLVVADNSRSLQMAERGEGQSRGEQLRASLNNPDGWLTRLAQDFDVRRYTFDTGLHPADSFSQLSFTGEASAFEQALRLLAERYRGKPVAGILLLTDGNATDAPRSDDAAATSPELPPIFPVALARHSANIDLSVTRITVSQTNFEAAPVTLAAEVEVVGLEGAAARTSGRDRRIVLRVLTESGEEVERRLVEAPTTASGKLAERFLVRPTEAGVSFYQVHAALAGEEALQVGDAGSLEATLANNRRYAPVDRGRGPYRVLYVSGHPNWEFKFLRRAVSQDDEVQLVGLVRIARKEPKFTFLARDGERTNPLFRGFGNKNDEAAEQYDEPVLLRLSTENQDELRGGFPRDASDLYRYHALILDDIESAFFTQDQLSLIQQFVSQRGGGLLMLGGRASYGEGGYARTPVGELLPVYLDRTPSVPPTAYRLKLTRDGWLQPWLRVRPTEAEEQQRLASLPPLRSLNRVDTIKPGAAVLAEVETADGATRPALVAQPFGRGRASALLLGDLWRWDLRRADPAQSDLEKSWRQLVRWLVADVPQRVDVETRRTSGAGLAATEIVIQARDAQYRPLDNARAVVTVTPPGGSPTELVAEPDPRRAGTYRVEYHPRVPGPYRARVTVTDPGGESVGERTAGWAVEPATDEFRRLDGDRDRLAQLAAASGGEVLELSRLDRFVASLPNRKLPITETWSYPLWHHWTVLALALSCLAGEWGLRRWKGWP